MNNIRAEPFAAPHIGGEMDALLAEMGWVGEAAPTEAEPTEVAELAEAADHKFESEPDDAGDEPDNEPVHHAGAFKTLGQLRDSNPLRQVITIQATTASGCWFYAYASTDDLEADRAALLAAKFVRERVDPKYQRRPFADIDARTYSPQTIAAAFSTAFRDGRPLAFGTMKGCHLVGSGFITVKAHRAGMASLAGLLPGKNVVDITAITSLRLAGSTGKRGTRKELPEGMSLASTLVQPLGAPLDHEADSPKNRAALVGATITAAEVTAGIAVLTDSPAALEMSAQVGNRINLERVAPSHCNVCDSVHDSIGAYLLVFEGEARGLAYCIRPGKGIPFVRPGVTNTANVYPGPFADRGGAETYLNPDGVNATPPGDVIDGSACGLGKSKAVNASIPAGASVVFVSYRTLFSHSQAAIYGYEVSCDGDAKAGPIAMTPGRRVFVQYESLHRVEGTPDVLVIDELHGIRRQACGGLCRLRDFAAFERLTREARRVVVLDARADNEGRAWVETIRGSPMKFVRNTATPHTDRTVKGFSAEKDYQEVFANYLAIRQDKKKKSEGWALANRFVVITQHRQAVENISKQLSDAGIIHKAYHGGTDQVVKATDFGNHVEAWKDCEAVVYNSVLEAGVSIEGSEWGTCFALFQGMGACEAAMQGMHRFRAVKTYFVHCAKPVGWGAYPTTEEGIIAAIHAGERFVKHDDVDDRTAGRDEHKAMSARPMSSSAYVAALAATGDIARSQFARFWIADALELNRSARYWAPRFYAMLADSGFQVERLAKGQKWTPRQDKKKPVDVKNPQLLFPVSPADRVANADAAAFAEKLEERGGEFAGNKTEAELHGEAKLKIMQAYAVPEEVVTAEFVTAFGGKALEAHRTIAKLVATECPTHAEASEALRRAEKDRDRMAPQVSPFCERVAVSLEAMQVLGFAGLDDLGVVSRDAIVARLAASAERVARIYARARLLWPNIGGRRQDPKTLKAHLSALNTIVAEMYHAKIISTTTRRTSFRIDVPSWPDNINSKWGQARPIPKHPQSHHTGAPPLDIEDILEALADFD
jgi:hypothetical protein